MAIIKKPYEISIWEDILMYVGMPVSGEEPISTKNINDLRSVDYQYYDEQRIATIGSNTMTSPMRAINPTFTRNINGIETLKFEMYYQYIDPITGQKEHNPLIDYLVNERKIKLYYEDDDPNHPDHWYDFIIKKDDERARDNKYSFTCNSLATAELGKTGFKIELDIELKNNMGTIYELGEKILEGSDWQIDEEKQQTLKQTVNEALYKIKINSEIEAFKYNNNNNNNNNNIVIPANKFIYVYYTPYNIQEQEFFQFIYITDNAQIKTLSDRMTLVCDDENIIDCYMNNVTWENGKLSFQADPSVTNNFYVSEYRGDRLVRKQKTIYDPILKKVVKVYKDNSNNKVVYGYQNVEYLDAKTVTNYIHNSTDFRGTSYWNTFSATGEGTSIEQITYPPVTVKNITDEFTSYLKVKIGNNKVIDGVTNYSYIKNDGIIYNYSKIDSFNKGETYIFRIKVKDKNFNYIKVSNSNFPFSCWIKKYEKEDIITNIADGMYFKFISSLAENDENDYVKIEAQCLQSVSWEELKKNIGIFLIRGGNYNNNEDYYIEDIQLYKGIKDSNNEYLHIGDVPEATYITTDFYYYERDNRGKIDANDYKYIAYSDSFIPQYGSGDKEFEKIRSISAKESNRFNLLQQLCETFECWVKFYIEHEQSGKIKIVDYDYYQPITLTENQFVPNTYYLYNSDTKKYVLAENYNDKRQYFNKITRKCQNKKVIFYGEILEKNVLGFKYGINLKDVTRTLDSDQIATKIIVKNNSQSTANNGFCSIARAKDNPTKENFIYNFDYYIKQGILNKSTLNNDLYEPYNSGYIGLYPKLKTLNQEKNELIEIQAQLSNRISDFTSDKETASLTMNSAIENLENLTNSTTGSIRQSTGYIYEDFYNQVTRQHVNNSIPVYSSQLYQIRCDENNGVQNHISINGVNNPAIRFYKKIVWNTIKVKGENINDYVDENRKFTAPYYYYKNLTTNYYHKCKKGDTVDDDTYYYYIGNRTIYEIKNDDNFFTEKNDALNDSGSYYLGYRFKVLEKESSAQTGITYFHWNSANKTFEPGFSTAENVKNYYNIEEDIKQFGANDSNWASTVGVLKGNWFISLGASTNRISLNSYTTNDNIEVYVYGARKRIEAIDDFTATSTATIKKLQSVATLTVEKKRAEEEYDQVCAILEEKQAEYDDNNEKLKQIAKATEEIENEFLFKYSRYIQEGSWIDENYMDDDLYYLDAVRVLYQSAYPKVSYNISVLELSALEEYQAYKFSIAHKTFIEDTEFFGWTDSSKTTPAREEVVVTETMLALDEPDKNTIKVQNYRTHFQDLFQRITASTQQLQLHSGEYGRASDAVTTEGAITQTAMAQTMASATFIIQNANNQSIAIDDRGLIATKIDDPAQAVKLTSGGLLISTDGGETYGVAINGYGINTNYLRAGTIDVDNINIISGTHPTFKWDGNGLRAISHSNNGENYNIGKYVTFDHLGIYGIDGLIDFVPQNVTEIEKNASFALTWNGFFLRSNYRNGYVSINPYDDIALYSYGNRKFAIVGTPNQLDWFDDFYYMTNRNAFYYIENNVYIKCTTESYEDIANKQIYTCQFGYVSNPVPGDNYYYLEGGIYYNYENIEQNTEIPLYEILNVATLGSTSIRRAKFGMLGNSSSGNELYGIELYDSDGNITLTTQSNGTLWLQNSIRIGDENNQNGQPRIYLGRGENVNNNLWKVMRVYNADDQADRFVLYSDGSLYASNGTFTGTINAIAGNIGGNEITENGLIINVSSNTGGLTIKNSSDEEIFYADGNGNLVLKGEIYAESGKIGGFTIGENEISSDNLILRSKSDTEESKIFVQNIDIGTGANIQEYLQVGNMRILNPEEDWVGNVKLERVLSLEHDNTGYFTLYNNGNIIGKGWSIADNGNGEILADFDYINVKDGSFTGTVHASDGEFTGKIYATDGSFSGSITASTINATTINTLNFITEEVRSMGGAFIFKPAFDISSIENIDNNNSNFIIKIKYNGSNENNYFNIKEGYNKVKTNLTEDELDTNRSNFKYIEIGEPVMVTNSDDYEDNVLNKLYYYDNYNGYIKEERDWNAELMPQIIYYNLTIQDYQDQPGSGYDLYSKDIIIALSGDQGVRYGRIIMSNNGNNIESLNGIITLQVQFNEVDYNEIDKHKDSYFSLTLLGHSDLDLMISVNSDNADLSNLRARSLTMSYFSSLLINNDNSSSYLNYEDKTILGDLNTKISEYGFGLYSEDVYLTGALTTQLNDNHGYAGINTLTKTESIHFPNEKIVFWAGAEKDDSESIKNSPFYVTSDGSIFASQGQFEGIVLSKSIIANTEILTPVVRGTGYKKDENIYEASLKIADLDYAGGIGFYQTNFYEKVFEQQQNDTIYYTKNNNKFEIIDINQIQNWNNIYIKTTFDFNKYLNKDIYEAEDILKLRLNIEGFTYLESNQFIKFTEALQKVDFYGNSFNTESISINGYTLQNVNEDSQSQLSLAEEKVELIQTNNLISIDGTNIIIDETGSNEEQYKLIYKIFNNYQCLYVE